MQLSQKESSLLKDLKAQEMLCAEKYSKSAQAASDTQLRDLFTSLSEIEQKHYQMLCQMESGAVPTVPSGGGNTQSKAFTATYGIGETPEKKNDCYLCQDLLTMEKHASGLYDTCVFEFSQQNARDLLNHIQKEEQGHGKQIYDYMSANSMQA